VINKPAGLVVHPGSGNWKGTLLNALLHHAPQLAAVPRAGIVHRLDKDTSGLLVVAKTLKAQTDLVRQLQARSMKREYLALVHGAVRGSGEVSAPVGRDPRNRTRMAVVPAGRHALTRYRVARRFAGASLLQCSLDTGRTHQIRVHMQSLGHPLVGDPVYRRGRGAESTTLRRQALHAARLEFTHPSSGARRRFEAPLPEDFRLLLDSLR
jgi:23S rRNA pseudouridine1911/1915/1917 synthase